MKPTVSFILGITISAFLLFGWLANFVDIVRWNMDAGITVEFIIRVAGILLFPLGALMGWFF